MKVSLIISVYKDVASLRTILEGLKFQRYKDFQIVVSEDGESEEMRSFLGNYTHENPILHLTQPDVGWRKNQALNRAIKNSDGDLLIVIDGDCVLHHSFVENHVRFATPGKVMAGKRVKLGPAFTALFKERINELPALERKVERERRALQKDGGQFYEEGLYFNPDGLFSFIPRLRRIERLKGCNMSFFRQDIEAINGFDEDYQLPAIGEDIDLTWRFKGLGYRFVSLRNFAIQYHLCHPEHYGADKSENMELMANKMRLKEYICRNGLRKMPSQ